MKQITDMDKYKFAQEAHFTIWSNGRADKIDFICITLVVSSCFV